MEAVRGDAAGERGEGGVEVGDVEGVDALENLFEWGWFVLVTMVVVVVVGCGRMNELVDGCTYIYMNARTPLSSASRMGSPSLSTAMSFTCVLVWYPYLRM